MSEDKSKEPHAYIYGRRLTGKEEAVVHPEYLEKIKKLLEQFFNDNDKDV